MSRPSRRVRTGTSRVVVAPAVAVAVVAGILLAPAGAGAAAGDDEGAAAAGAGRSTLPPDREQVVRLDHEPGPDEVPPEDRTRVLGRQWSSSRDRAWVTSGDGDGFHVMVADAADAYAFRTVASLAEPGFATDRWIGNACVTASGKRAAVVYAPRGFTNDSELFLRGAFGAVVDLTSGAVTKLPFTSSLEYFSPTCGHGEQALFTRSGGEELGATRLVTVDARNGHVVRSVEAKGQLTSAVLTGTGIVAAAGSSVVRVDRSGGLTELARARSAPYRLTADRDGGLVYLDHSDDRAAARRLDARRLRSAEPARAVPELARGPRDDLGLTASAGGDVLVTGNATAVGVLPSAVDLVGSTSDARSTVLGEATVEATVPYANVLSPGGVVDPTAPLDVVDVTLRSVVTGEQTELTVLPGGADVADETSPSLADGPGVEGGPGAAVGGRTSVGSDPVDTATCAVPVNDVNNQTTQPKPRQVEWAVNQAVKGVLTVQRPANWKQLGMAAYTPQGLFPPRTLSGGGGEVPSQVMLGILAQESNLWMAPRFVAPGMTGSPLVGNYYGQTLKDSSDDSWRVNWSKADCGYGVAQVTDGMRAADTGKPGRSTLQQRAIALDFAANVAAGLQILQDKWNQVRDAGLKINDGNPARIENWYYAVWAYNSGFYPYADRFTEDRNGAWGLGYGNNPANPSYDPARTPFGKHAGDAAKPQLWPYPEKVMGFAAYPPSLLEFAAPDTDAVYVAAYRAASWNGTTADANKRRDLVQAPWDAFCLPSNDCDPAVTHHRDQDGYDWGPCAHRGNDGDYNGHCWVHESVTWKTNCDLECGRPFLRFVEGYAYQEDGTSYPANCSMAGLPTGALVVDDIPTSAPDPRCTPPTPSAGTFSMRFGSAMAGNTPDTVYYPSKTDFHQLGGGFGGHFWFGHARTSDLRGDSMRVTGTWTLDRSLDKWTRVLVHLPSLGAHTQQARYRIDLGNGVVKHRTILQRTMRNGWVSLGVFRVSGTPSVTLSTATFNGDGPADDGTVTTKNEDVAFDAVAFVPLAAKPAHFVVAMGDSYSSGEGGTTTGQYDYYRESANNGDDADIRNACHRSPWTWSRVARLPGSPQTIGERADALDPSLDYHLIACSGATVKNLLPTRDGFPDLADPPRDAEGEPGLPQYGELTQIDQGFLDENTTLVTLSIGGNDAGFSKIITKCIATPPPLPGPPILSCPLLPDDWGLSTLGRTVPERMATVVEDSIVTALAEVHRRAPNAEVKLMGYPQLLSSYVCFTQIDPIETDWLNGLAHTLAQHMSEAKDRANQATGTPYVTFMNPIQEFDGKAICGSPESVHGIVAKPAPGEMSLTPVSMQSFHPKREGYQLYANVLTAALAQ